jgi:two-component system sensor histidine kinase HydH
VTVAVTAERDRLVIAVADRGPGVPETDRDKIFEPFVTGKTRGTGLGLAVTKRIVELHGGAIAVLSNPGGGALFRVEIPKG